MHQLFVIVEFVSVNSNCNNLYHNAEHLSWLQSLTLNRIKLLSELKICCLFPPEQWDWSEWCCSYRVEKRILAHWINLFGVVKAFYWKKSEEGKLSKCLDYLFYVYIVEFLTICIFICLPIHKWCQSIVWHYLEPRNLLRHTQLSTNMKNNNVCDSLESAKCQLLITAF